MSNGKLFDKVLLSQIRERFACIEADPFGGKRIYLENSGGSLTLHSVLEAVAQFTALPDNAGRVNATSRQIDRVIAQGTEDVKCFMGARSGVVALGESTTSNAFKILTAIIRNVPGSNIATTNLDHPSIYDSTKILAQRFGKEWRVAGLCKDKGAVEPEAVLECVDSQTIVLAIIHGSNNLGTKNNVKEIISRVREKNPDLYVLVDGSQFCMHSLIDVEELGCDGYLASSYKTFGKIGAAPLFISERAAKLSHDKLVGKPETYWELGTREAAGYASWSAVVDYLCWLGGHFTDSEDKRTLICSAMRAIEEHEMAMTYRMLHGTDKIKGMLQVEKVAVYGEVQDLSIKDPAFLFNIDRLNSSESVKAFDELGIRVHNRINDAYSAHTVQALGIEEGVRVSAAHYNSPQEIDAFLKVLQEVAK